MLDRRTLLKSFCAGSALLLAQAKAWEFRGDSGLGGNIRIWDQHAHLGSVPGDTPEERMAFLVKCMDRVGVERLILSQGYSADQHPNPPEQFRLENDRVDRKSTRLNSSHLGISYAVFCLKKKSIEDY